MRESSLSCRARSDLASSPCSEPTPIVLASPWLGRLTGRLEGRQPAGWHGTASGSSTPPPPRMPSGGRGGVRGAATGARDREELWPEMAKPHRFCPPVCIGCAAGQRRTRYRRRSFLHPVSSAPSSAGLRNRAVISSCVWWRDRCCARACALWCCSRPSGRRPCDCSWALRLRCAAAAAAGTPM